MCQLVQVSIQMRLTLPKSPKGLTGSGGRNDKTRDGTLSTASIRPPTNPGSSYGSSSSSSSSNPGGGGGGGCDGSHGSSSHMG